ncbi:MAG: fibronectin type III domain-containing protein [Flavobacteriales bacterium]|nr:fibronectin type III domain-containing protein [Flavobacteriales bacterium]
MTGPRTMKKQYYVVKLGHSRVGFEKLVDMTGTNVSMLTGNAAFPTPSPTLAALTAAAARLEAATQAYLFSRSRLDKQERDIAFRELKLLRQDLGGYVQTTSNGDPELITSAGFEMAASPKPVGLLPAPKDVLALVRPFPGSLEVRFGGVKRRLAYQLYICDSDPLVEANWRLHTVTGKTRVQVDGLESGKSYFFRVEALGAAGVSPVSDITSAKAA